MSEIIIRKSVLTIYKDCQIIPNRNFIVDYIETYLSKLTNFGISDFQYLRPSLEMTIKIHRSEDFCSMLLVNNYNYLKVAQDSRTYYYFVIKKTQRAEETIELELVMDTINTFRYGSDFIATERTKVIREHKDRFEKLSTIPSISVWEFADIPMTPSKTLFDIDYVDSSLGVEVDQEMIDDINEYPVELYLYSVYDSTLGRNLDVGEEVEMIEGTPYFVLGEYPRVYAQINLQPGFEDDELYFTFEYDTLRIASDTLYKRKIDLYSEGLNPILYKEEKGTLYPPELNNWYLIYKNKASPDNEAVDCFLAPLNPIQVKANTGNTILPSSLDSNVYYLFSRVGNVSQDTIFKTASGNLKTALTADAFGSYYQAVILRKSNDGTKIQAYLTTYTRRYIGGQWVWTGSQQTFSGEFTTIQWLSGPLDCYKGNDISTPSGNNSSLSGGGISSVTLNAFSSFNRTLSDILKIIALPYLPSSYKIDNGVLVLPPSWEFDSTYGFMKLTNLDEKFESQIITEVENPFKPLSSFEMTPATNATRYLKDPKLLHSDYYQPKFIYDSFGFTFQLEKMDREYNYSESYFSFSFVMTSTIRSRFMFKFDSYKLTYSTQDYDNILSVNRNNEVVIYNSAYLTYLRTGYNIDVKAKERTQRTAILGGVLSTIGSIAGIGLGVASENPAVAVKGAISGASSIVSTIVNSINTIAQSEESMERNLATLKAQAVSVEGSDDLDLLENYSENKAKLAVYKVSPKMESILDDLFYYTGYISGEMKLPNITSRYWFNFLSCDLDITGVNSAIPELCLTDLKSRYQAGVFFLHRHGEEYNFELNKENWEISLL